MNTQRLLLIVNPISGTKSKDELIPRIETRLAEKGYAVTTRLTKCHGDATRLASDAIECRYDLVAVCGGDGTVNETARTLCGTDIPMAILPAGSGNGLARHIGLSTDPLAAVDIIDPDHIRECDYGEVNGQKFFTAFGVGFDGAVTRAFAEAGTRGLATYLRKAVQTFTHYHPKDYLITIDGDKVLERKAYMVACCNASQYGNNTFVAPGASITDGYFDVIVLRDAPHIKTLLAGLDMLTGMLPYNRQVEIIRARDVRIQCAEKPQAHIDGEPLDVGTDIHITMHHGRLKLFADLSHEHFKPILTPIEYATRDITASINKWIAETLG